jgi:5'-nucleotidase
MKMVPKKILAAAALAVAAAACSDRPEPLAPETAEGRRGNPDAPGLSKPAFQLTLLHNNDGESELLPDGDFGGVARFTTLVGDLKREALEECPVGPIKCETLMVSSGDNFLAGPQFNASLERGIPFFDAMTMGNHEFDFGPDVLADFIESFETEPPFLSSNLDFSAEPRLAALEGRRRIAASTVTAVPGRGAVGIIGATTTNLASISSPRGVRVIQDVAGQVNAEAASLEAQGVDKIILISHLQSIEEDRMLTGMLRGIDIVVAGGGDNLLANSGDLLVPGDVAEDSYPVFATDADGRQVPLVTTSGGYRYVGRLVATFDKLGRLVEIGDESGPVRVAGGGQPDAVTPDAEVEATVEAPVAASVADLAANVIGTTQVPLDGLRASVRTQETNQGNLVADAHLTLARDLAGSFGVPAPDVALQNGGGMRDDDIVPAGPITELKTFEILPFSNVLSVVPGVSRERFKEILENAVSRVEFNDGRFAQIAGFAMVYDAAGTPQIIDPDGVITQVGSRVRDVVLEDGTVIVSGGAVVGGPDLTVATINFLAAGGDQYPFGGLPFTNLGLTYQQSLEDYIEGPLGGVVTAADYPAGGEGRITRIN